MHFLLGKFVLIILHFSFVFKIVKGVNFHDFDLSCERIHYRCRTKVYPSSVQRLTVPDNKVRWDCPWPEYNPPLFTATSTVGQPWADPDLSEKIFNVKWNSVDGLVDRRSYVTTYNVSENYPLNPIGRTGLGGRGVLGRWGPNHAADSAVTRWKRNENGELILNTVSKKPILQLITIQKRSREWGIPGGMVEPGENTKETSKREFFEEVLAYDVKSSNPACSEMLNTLFEKGLEIYKGYVDDPRNTDNAWVETVVFHYHDAGQMLDSLRLTAGDDALNVSWMDVDRDIQLYSAHQKFVNKMTNRLNSHF